MPPPVGKHKPMMRGRAPWNSLDADHKIIADNIHQSFIHKTPQPEIDICLNCTDLICNGKKKKKIRQCRHEAYVERQKKYKREFPPGFEKDARDGMRNVDLAVKYKLTKYMVDILKKDLGIYPKKFVQDLEQFKKDALAGMSINGLNRKYHMSKERIHKLFKEYGIDRKRSES